MSLVAAISPYPAYQPCRRAPADTPEQLLLANLLSVFRDGDPDGIVDRIWHRMPVVYEADGAAAGREAVARAADRFRAVIGAARFRTIGSVTGHNGLYVLRWEAVAGRRRVASGCHLASVRDGRIDSLYCVYDAA